MKISFVPLIALATRSSTVAGIRCQWLQHNVPGIPDFPGIGDYPYNEMRCSTYTEYCVFAYSGEMEFRDCDFEHKCSAENNGECREDANGVTYCCCNKESCNSEDIMPMIRKKS